MDWDVLQDRAAHRAADRALVRDRKFDGTRRGSLHDGTRSRRAARRDRDRRAARAARGRR